MSKIDLVEQKYLKTDIPKFNVGDTVRVKVRIREGEKTRIQVFEGAVIAKRGRGINATFTVRRVVFGEGIERTFLVHSPNVEGVDIVRHGKVRRAKLYFLRDKIGKTARIKERDVR